MAKDTADNFAIKQLWHFIQLIFTDRFQMFDTVTNNQEVYGSSIVPVYNLSNLNVPITVFYGTKDIMVNATVSFTLFNTHITQFYPHLPIQDVEKFISHVSTIKSTIKLPWSHMDYISGKDAPTTINQYIIKELDTYKIVVPSTTVPPEEYRRSQNIFEIITDFFKKLISNRN